jgi:hypothetical protein
MGYCARGGPRSSRMLVGAVPSGMLSLFKSASSPACTMWQKYLSAVSTERPTKLLARAVVIQLGRNLSPSAPGFDSSRPQL